MNRPRDPALAAVLSLLIPGAGQIYNGDFLRGLFWIIVTPGIWLGTGGLLGWLAHVAAAVTARSRARRLLRDGVPSPASTPGDVPIRR
jgi:TM2 domain-containing membrane protein YozV